MVMDLLPQKLDWATKSHRLNEFGVIVIVFLVAKQVADTFRNVQSMRLNAKMIFRLRKRLFARLLGLVAQRPVGDEERRDRFATLGRY